MNTSHRNGTPVDMRSFRLGMIYCFAEMVDLGVKKLALSPPVTPEEYEEIREGSEKTVRDFGIKSFLERSFLVTDLFTEELTAGKWVVLYFREDGVLERYLELKGRKETLVNEGNYSGDVRKDIAREFGRLLGYPESNIEKMLESGPRSLP